MNSARTVAPWDSQQGRVSPRRRKRAATPAAAPVSPLATGTPRATTVNLPQPNIQARVIAALITGLGLLIISLAGVRMLGSEEPTPQQAGVLAPHEVFILEQARDLDRERARGKVLADKIDHLLALGKSNSAQLRERDDRLREQQDLLRDKTESLHKAQAEAEDAVRQLRAAKTELEEKDRRLRAQEDRVREDEARLKTYESARRESDRQLRELETKLTKAKAASTAALAEEEWPALLRNNLDLGRQVRELKRLIDVLDKETDADSWALTMQQTSELIGGLRGRLQGYSTTDAAANDAKFFLSDTLPTRLNALKNKKR
jgi:hypothetical protein